MPRWYLKAASIIPIDIKQSPRKRHKMFKSTHTQLESLQHQPPERSLVQETEVLCSSPKALKSRKKISFISFLGNRAHGAEARAHEPGDLIGSIPTLDGFDSDSYSSTNVRSCNHSSAMHIKDISLEEALRWRQYYHSAPEAPDAILIRTYLELLRRKEKKRPLQVAYIP